MHTEPPTPPSTGHTAADNPRNDDAETLDRRVDRLEQRSYPRKLTPEQLAAYRRILDQQATTR